MTVFMSHLTAPRRDHSADDGSADDTRADEVATLGPEVERLRCESTDGVCVDG